MYIYRRRVGWLVPWTTRDQLWCGFPGRIRPHPGHRYGIHTAVSCRTVRNASPAPVIGPVGHMLCPGARAVTALLMWDVCECFYHSICLCMYAEFLYIRSRAHAGMCLCVCMCVYVFYVCKGYASVCIRDCFHVCV